MSPALGVICDSGTGMSIGCPMPHAERRASPAAAAIERIATLRFIVVRSSRWVMKACLKADTGAGPGGKNRCELPTDCAGERFPAHAEKQLGRGRVDILHNAEAVGTSDVTGEDDLILLRKIDAEGGAAKIEEVVLIAKFRVEQVWGQLLAEGIAITWLAYPSCHSQTDTARVQD